MILKTVESGEAADFRAARAIARKLIPFERKLDEVVEDAAELFHVIAKARRQADSRAPGDDRAFSAAGAAIGTLMVAFDQMALCHSALEQSRDARSFDGEGVGCTPGGKAALRASLVESRQHAT